MMKALFRVCLFTTFVSLAGSVAIAQTRIHAVSGTVTSIHTKIGMIDIATDDGSSGHFEFLKKTDPPVDFDKNVRADAVDVDKFTNKGAHVILYFVGQGDVRTAVAVRDLGDGSFAQSSGSVVRINRHDHILTIKNSSGVEESFHIDPKTVADTPTGVVEGFKLDYSKGDQVRVTAAQANGGETAVLIAPAM
jgi:hypothetical protein